jgi:hypothetical protein
VQEGDYAYYDLGTVEDQDGNIAVAAYAELLAKVNDIFPKTRCIPQEGCSNTDWHNRDILGALIINTLISRGGYDYFAGLQRNGNGPQISFIQKESLNQQALADGVANGTLATLAIVSVADIENWLDRESNGVRQRDNEEKSSQSALYSATGIDLDKVAAIMIATDFSSTTCLAQDAPFAEVYAIMLINEVQEWVGTRATSAVQINSPQILASPDEVFDLMRRGECVATVGTVQQMQTLAKALEREKVEFFVYPQFVDRNVVRLSFAQSLGFSTLNEYDLSRVVNPPLTPGAMEFSALAELGVNTSQDAFDALGRMQKAGMDTGIGLNSLLDFLADERQSQSTGRPMAEVRSSRLEREAAELSGARSQYAAAHPYRLIATCTIAGNSVGVRNCILGSTSYAGGQITITVNGIQRFFTLRDIIDEMSAAQLAIDLTSSFSVTAQSNGNDLAVMDMRVFDSENKLLFQEQASQYSIIQFTK